MSYTISAKASTLQTSTKMNLTPEQIQRMEENRQKALAKKNSKLNNNENNDPKQINTINTMNNTKLVSLFNNSAPQQPKPSIFNNPSKINTIQNTTTFSGSSKPTNFAASKPAISNTSGSNSVIDSLHGRCVPLEEDPENRFEIIIGYNKAVIDIFKSIKGKKYDPNTKRWNFSKKSYDEIMLQIKCQQSSVKIEPLDRNAGKNAYLKFFLINKSRFEVICTEFKPELNELFKSKKSKYYDAKEKKWSFDLSEYENLVAEVNSRFKDSVTVIPLPKSAKEIFKNQIAGKKIETSREDEIDEDYLKAYIDPTIIKSLLPFQVDSICFALKKEGRLLLADDMGLGKTIQGLAIASFYKEEWPVFIVCPSSVKFMWKENTKRWISHSIREACDLVEDEPVDDYIQVMESGKQNIDPNAKIVIASYEFVSRNVEKIIKTIFQVVIADECHLLKNTRATRTKSTLKLLENAKRVLLMSGTPALNRPSELYSQISAINPVLFNNFHEFGIRYCNAKETKYGTDYSGYSNMNELRTILEESLLIRREKKDVLTQLPSKTRETIVLNPALIELNSKTLKEASNASEKGKGGIAAHGALLNYFQETSRVKARAVAEYILDLLESGKKFLVFAHHKNMLDSLQAELEENKYDFIRIDGSTTSENRQVFVDKFQNDENCLCALLSICAANSGITLTAACLVCFAELYWNPGILVQAEDRVYRIGQKNAVNIQYLCAKGTADDDLWCMIKDKLEVLNKVGLTKESMVDTKQSVMESSKEDVDKLNAFIEESEKQNKITKCEEKEKKAAEKSGNVVSKKKSTTSQSKTDTLLDGIDFDELDEPSTVIKSKSSKKQSKIDELLNDVDFDEIGHIPLSQLDLPATKQKLTKKSTKIDELLNGVNFDEFDEDPPVKSKQKLSRKQIDNDDDLLNGVNLEEFDQVSPKKISKKSIIKINKKIN